ncbi:hypothetical protein HJFPF1_00386 [Paramyrothecium foliicola]|nr:hypothetical protein HJFPF1_00386 [Paramyrothecium foliicola]
MSASCPSAPGGDESVVPETPPSTAHQPASQPPKPKRKRLRRPARGSLSDTLRQNAGVSLFVRPICWTDLHSQLLGAHFEELPPCTTPLPANIPGSPPSKGHMRPSHTITTLSDALTEIVSPAAMHPLLSSNAVRTVLVTLWPQAFGRPQFLPELHLYFGGRVYRDAIRTQVMWSYPAEDLSSFKTVSTRPADSFNVPSTASSGSPNLCDAPMLCYMSKSQLASIRKNLFRVAPGPNRSWNEPVYRLQQLRAKTLIPANSDHDAHFVGIFLAMAQRHFYNAPPPSARKGSQWYPSNQHPPQPNFQDLKLRILSHDNDTAEFLVYTGHVTAKFLERFHNTHQVPQEEGEEVPGIKIEYTRVPIWPILGLRERLGKAFGQDIVGSFNSEEIKTWDEEDEVEDVEEETDEVQGNGKRKREALSEVFNGSFDSDSEDESVLQEKRRRLSEAAPVGLVI